MPKRTTEAHEHAREQAKRRRLTKKAEQQGRKQVIDQQVQEIQHLTEQVQSLTQEKERLSSQNTQITQQITHLLQIFCVGLDRDDAGDMFEISPGTIRNLAKLPQLPDKELLNKLRWRGRRNSISSERLTHPLLSGKYFV